MTPARESKAASEAVPLGKVVPNMKKKFLQGVDLRDIIDLDPPIFDDAAGSKVPKAKRPPTKGSA
jgi:hypothetical protein